MSTALRPALAMALAAGLAWTSSAFGAEASTELEQIKQEALDLAVQAADARAPDQGSLDVYLALDSSSLRMVSAGAVIDGAAVQRDGFSVLEDRAFAAGGWYRLAQVVRGDKHSIHVEAVIGAVQGDQQAKPLQLQADMALEPQDVDADGALVAVVDSAIVGAPKLRLIQLRAIRSETIFARLWSQVPVVGGVRDHYVPGSVDDPEMRRASFLSSTQQYLEAAAAIRRRQQGQPGCLDPHCQVALAEALLDYGLPAQAIALEPEWRKGEAQEVFEVRRRIAEGYYRHGDFRAAEEALGTPPPRRREAQLLAWQDLKYRVVLGQGRIGDAIPVLRAMKPEAGFEGYVRYYNLGVALVANGNASQGLTILGRIGSMYGDSRRMLGLRDQANLAAGIYFLQEGQGATAIPLLEKIHEQGAMTGRALLALGWAWLAPPGTEQDRVQIGDERTVGVPPESANTPLEYKGDQNLYQRFEIHPFERAGLGTSQPARVQRAIAVWTELAEHQGTDNVVPEALLAMGAKLEEEGDSKDAASRDERAIALLEQSLAAIGRADEYVVGDQAEADLYAPDASLAFDREVHRLPPEPAASYLGDTIASWDFQERLAAYRDARVLAAQLAALSQATQSADAIGGLQVRLGPATAELRGQLQEPLRQELADRKRYWSKLLEQARLALAGVYDRGTQN